MTETTTEGRAWEYKGGVVVQTTRPPIPNLSDVVTVVWHDSRARTPEQLRKAWALMGEIAAFQGQGKDDTYKEQQLAFSLKSLDMLNGELFHLSSATVSKCSAFISMLIELIVENGIPTKDPLYDVCEDITRYVYICTLNKVCAVCRRKAELHHVDHVGAGFNRREICHIGMRCLPLCRGHHTEAHSIGETVFQEKYHLVPIEIDERIAKAYRLKTT